MFNVTNFKNTASVISNFEKEAILPTNMAKSIAQYAKQMIDEKEDYFSAFVFVFMKYPAIINMLEFLNHENLFENEENRSLPEADLMAAWFLSHALCEALNLSIQKDD